MSDGPRTASQPRRRGFYYHRHPATACRRRVAALWSQFPPRPHPQPPTLRPSNNAAPRTPRATPIHNLTIAAFADATSTPPAPTGGFTTIDTPPRRVAGVSQPYGRNSPHTPTHNHQPRAHSRPSHDQTQPPTHANGGFTTIDAPPRRVAGVSQPYGRNSPHAPTHNRQPRPRPCRFRATNLRLPLRTPRGGLPRAAWVPGRPGDIGSLSGTRRLGAPLHWCHA